MSQSSWFTRLKGAGGNDDKKEAEKKDDEGQHQQEQSTPVDKPAEELSQAPSSTLDTTNTPAPPITQSLEATPPSPAVPSMTAEELRRKRLERFGATPSSSPSSTPSPAVSTPTPSTPSTPTNNNTPATHVTPSPNASTTPSTPTTHNNIPPTTPVSPPTTNPSSSNPAIGSPSASKPIEVINTSKRVAVPVVSTTPPSPGFGLSPSQHVSPGGTANLASHEQWENQVIERIFQVSLNSQPKDSNYLFLKGLRSELDDDAPLLSNNLIEHVLFERLSTGAASHRKNHIAYLIGCYHRTDEELQKSSTKKSVIRTQVLETILDFIISYSSLVLLNPEDWPSNVKSGFREEVASRFLESLLADPDTSTVASQEFLDLLIKRLDDKQLSQIFMPVFDELAFNMKAMTLMGSFVPLFRVFALLTKFKSIANLLPTLPNWIPAHNLCGREIETNSFLGPFFRLTSCPSDPTVGNHYFAAPTQMSKANKTIAHSAIRMSLTTSQRLCHETLKGMLTAGGRAKEAVLDWVGAILKYNLARTMMQADRQKTSGDGFMLNLGAVMLQLCVPFLDPSSPKVNMIDPTYLLTNARVGLMDDTKLAATSEEVKQFLAERKSDNKPPGFITECFFLTLKTLHTGLLPVFLEYGAIIKTLLADRNTYDAFEGSRSQWPESAVQENENLLLRLQARIDNIDRHRLSYESQLFEPGLLDHATQFYLLLAVWLTRLADPEKKGLPLDAPVAALATLPEHCVEDVVDFFVFISRYLPDRLDGQAGLDDLITFLVLFLGSPTHVKNPYLRSKLVDLMHALTPKVLGRNLGLYENNVCAQKHLARVLMAFYVDIEFADRSHNFYEKFNTRYDVASVMKHIWQIPEHKRAIEKESNDEKLFLRFVNMLINDSIYLLDESLNKLAEIRTLELAMEDKAVWNRQDPDTREEREEHFKRLERQVGTYMLLANETINMMHYLTADVTTPFLRPELVDRLASMLNYFLQQLAGPKCTNLKVTKPDKYHFRPKVLLGQIVDMYSHFGSKEKLSLPFAEAVARDDRSYDEELFPRVIHILRREGLRPEPNILKFEGFMNLVKEAAAKAKDSEENLGEIPDDYLDPIMATLMTDPVILPTSGKTMDRAVIARHLLSDNKDPFNRQYLTVEMLQPNEALKKEIDEWLKSKGQRR